MPVPVPEKKPVLDARDLTARGELIRAGVDNGIKREPLVRTFAMGSNRWLTGNTYPLEGTILEKWHLASDGQANGLKGNGRLVRAVGGAETDAYDYDPGDLTPEPSYYEEPERAKGAVASEGDLKERARAGGTRS